MFSPDLGHARRLFNDFVGEKAQDGHSEEFYGKNSLDPRFVGQDQFVDTVLKQQLEGNPGSAPDLNQVLTAVKTMYDLTDEDLSSSSQKRSLSEARMLAAWAIREESCATLAELAHVFHREPSAMSAAAERFDELRKKDQQAALKVEELKVHLSLFQA